MTAHDKIKAADAVVEHPNVFAALAAAQAEMRAPEKNAENPAFKRDNRPMKYADLSAVVESIREPLTRHGLCWGWRSVVEGGQVLWVAFIHHGASGTETVCAVPVGTPPGNNHAFKSAITYAKRIGLESVSGQAPGDDDDGNAAAAAAPKQEARRQAAPAHPLDPSHDKPITADQFRDLRDLVDKAGADEAKMLAWLKAPALEELTQAQFETAAAMLRKKIAYVEAPA